MQKEYAPEQLFTDLRFFVRDIASALNMFLKQTYVPYTFCDFVGQNRLPLLPS